MSQEIERNKISIKNLKELYGIFKQFAEDYNLQGVVGSGEEWLTKCYYNAISGLTKQEAEKLSRETIESILTFNDGLSEISESTAKGESKESWFATKTLESFGDRDVNACGEYLVSLDEALMQGNAESIGDSIQLVDIEDGEERAEWNAFNVKNVALHLGKNAVMAGLQTLTKTDEAETFINILKDEDEFSDEKRGAFLSDDDAPLKSAMTAALKVGVENKLLPFIPINTSVETLANVACVGVERIRALSKLTTGEFTVSQVLEHMGNASIVMVHNLCSKGAGDLARIALSWIPVVGPVLGNVVGAMITAASKKKFAETITVASARVRSAAVTAVNTIWKGIKTVGQKIKNTAKNFCKFLFS